MFAEKIEFSSRQPFRVKVQKINRYPIHWHEGVTEIILPIRGDVEVVANFEHLTVREGDFHFINNRSVHSLRSDSNAVVVLICNPFIDDKRQAGEDLADNRVDEKTRFRNLLIDTLLRKKSYELSAQTMEDLANRLVYSMIFEFNWLTFYKSNEGKGVDAAIVAGGDDETFNTAIAVTKNGGNIAMLNVLPEVATFGIPTIAASSFLGHKTIRGGLCPGGRKRAERLLSMVSAGRVDPGKMITHKFKGLSSIEDAFKLMANKPKDLIKPIVYFEYND